MPVTLENGLVIYNVTAHDLNIWDHVAKRVVIAPSDGVVNGVPISKEIQIKKLYVLSKTKFIPNEGGNRVVASIQEREPEAVIIGSIVAAQAYPGRVVAGIPLRPTRFAPDRATRPIRADRFTIFTELREI